jgi:nucleoside-diphosphate-sugar epimerase
MRVFVTGATGFIGSEIVKELINNGHQVLGLTRSDAGAEALIAAGAEVHHGNIEDLDSLRSGAAQSDGVIHTAFNHDFSKFVQNCENDRLAIEAMGEVLAGTNRHLVITSGTGMGSAGHGMLATEDVFNLDHPNPRQASEIAAETILKKRVSVSVVRLPQVHDPYKQGLISPLITMIRDKGVAAYIGEGQNRWPAVHVLDAARAYRLAFERHEAGARYNLVAEEGISMKSIIEVIGKVLNIPSVSISPEEAPAYFGWLDRFSGLDMPASSVITRAKLGWEPTGPGMLADLEQGKF